MKFYRTFFLTDESEYHIHVVFICHCMKHWRRNWQPLQCSCLENPMDKGAWWAAVHGVAKSRAWLSGFTFTFHFNALEKEMATHSSVLAWRIPGTGEPGGLPSMGSHRVGHDWSDLAAAAAAFHRPVCRGNRRDDNLQTAFFCLHYLCKEESQCPNEYHILIKPVAKYNICVRRCKKIREKQENIFGNLPNFLLPSDASGKTSFIYLFSLRSLCP